MLTDDQIRLAADAHGLRRAEDEHGRELWFAPHDDVFAEAARLWERGYLARRWHGDDLVFRFSDRAMAAQELTTLVLGQSPN